MAVTPRLIWAKDSYHVGARDAAHGGGDWRTARRSTSSSAHLPALVAYASARVTWVNTFKTWAASFAGPKVVGGDFNERPTEKAVISMTQHVQRCVGGRRQRQRAIPTSRTARPRSIAASTTCSSTRRRALRQTSVKVVGRRARFRPRRVVRPTRALDGGEAPPPAPAPRTPTAPRRRRHHDAGDRARARADRDDAVRGPLRRVRRHAVADPGHHRHAGFDHRFAVGRRPASADWRPEGRRDRLALQRHQHAPPTTSSNSGCASVQLAQASEPVDHGVSRCSRWCATRTTCIAGISRATRWLPRRRSAGVKTTLATCSTRRRHTSSCGFARRPTPRPAPQDVVFETAADNGGVPGAYTERYPQDLGRRR